MSELLVTLLMCVNFGMSEAKCEAQYNFCIDRVKNDRHINNPERFCHDVIGRHLLKSTRQL